MPEQQQDDIYAKYGGHVISGAPAETPPVPPPVSTTSTSIPTQNAADDPYAAYGGSIIGSTETTVAARPDAKPGPYQTALSSNEEMEFRQWVKSDRIPFDPDEKNADYDMRGFWKAMRAGDPMASRDAKTRHFPDIWKTPYHKTFSNESMYALPTAPHWEGDHLVSTPTEQPGSNPYAAYGGSLIDNAADPYKRYGGASLGSVDSVSPLRSRPQSEQTPIPKTGPVSWGEIFPFFSGEGVNPNESFLKRLWDVPLVNFNPRNEGGLTGEFWNTITGFTTPVNAALALGTLGSGAIWKTTATAALEAARFTPAEIASLIKGAEVATEAERAGADAAGIGQTIEKAGINPDLWARGTRALSRYGMSTKNVLDKQGLITGGGAAVLRKMGASVLGAQRFANTAQHLVDAGFTWLQLQQFSQTYPQFFDALKEGDTDRAMQMAMRGTLTGIAGTAGILSGLSHLSGPLRGLNEKYGNLKPNQEWRTLRDHFRNIINLGEQQADRDAQIFRDGTRKQFRIISKDDNALEATKLIIESEFNRDRLAERFNYLTTANETPARRVPLALPAPLAEPTVPRDIRTAEEAEAARLSLPTIEMTDAERRQRYQELANQQMLRDSNRYTPKEREALLQAYETALGVLGTPENQLSPKQRAMLDLAHVAHDVWNRVGAIAQDHDVLHDLLNGYTTNMYTGSPEEPVDNPALNQLRHEMQNGRFATNVPMARHRVFANSFEAQLLGYKLANTDPIDLVGHSIASVGYAIAHRKALANLMDNSFRASDRRPAILVSGDGTRVRGSNGEDAVLYVRTDRLHSPFIPQVEVETMRQNGQLARDLKAGNIIEIPGRGASPLAGAKAAPAVALTQEGAKPTASPTRPLTELSPAEQTAVSRYWNAETAGPVAQRLYTDLQKEAKATPGQADAVMMLIGAEARYMGEPIEDFIQRRIVRIRQGGIPDAEALFQRASRNGFIGTDGTVIPVGANEVHDTAAKRLGLGNSVSDAIAKGAVRFGVIGDNVHFQVDHLTPHLREVIRQTLLDHFPNAEMVSISADSPKELYSEFTREDAIQALRRGTPLADVEPTLFQEGRGVKPPLVGTAGLPKGATQFLNDGRAIIYAFKDGDFSTIIHELGHVFRRDLAGDDLSTIERHLGITDGTWERSHEEQFARWIERYFTDGEAPNPELQPIFGRIAAWMRSVYQRIKSSAIARDIPDEVRATLDKRFGVEPTEVERYQWMRNKEAGQRFGNQQEIRPLTEEAYNQFVRNKLRGRPTYKTYLRNNPEATHLSLFKEQGAGDWALDKVGSLDEIRPTPEVPNWVIPVSRFDSPEAQNHSMISDSLARSLSGQPADMEALHVLAAGQTAATTTAPELKARIQSATNWYRVNRNAAEGLNLPLELRVALDRTLGIGSTEGGPESRYVWNSHGYLRVEHSDFHRWLYRISAADGTPIIVRGEVMVHPEFFNYINREVGGEKSIFQTNPFLKQAMKASSFAKHSILSLTGFHPGQLALRALMSGVIPRVVDWNLHDDPLAALLVENGLMAAPRYGMDALEDGMVRSGLSTSGRGIASKIPLVRDINDKITHFTFDDLLPSLKILVGKKLYQRWLTKFQDENFARRYVEAHPDFIGLNTQRMAARAAAYDTNVRLGNLDYRGLGTSMAAMDFMKLTTLAPDWLLSEIGLVKRMFDPTSGVLLRRDLARFVGLMWVTARVANMIFTGKMHNEAPFGVVMQDDRGRDKVYSLRTLPTDFLHLAEDPWGFMTHRVSPLVRGGYEAISQRENLSGGRKLTPGQAVVDILRNAVVPIPFQNAAQGLVGRFAQQAGIPSLTQMPSQFGATDELVKVVGGTSAIYRTVAQKRAAELSAEKNGQGPLTDAASIRRNQLMGEFEDRIRSGQMQLADLSDAIKQGALSSAQAKKIMANVGATAGLEPEQARLVMRVSRLPMSSALEVWSLASREERAALKTTMHKMAVKYVNSANKEKTLAERQADPLYRQLVLVLNTQRGF